MDKPTIKKLNERQFAISMERDFGKYGMVPMQAAVVPRSALVEWFGEDAVKRLEEGDK